MKIPKGLKTTVTVFEGFIILPIMLWGLFWSLPLSITRYSDIQLGNRLVTKIERYKLAHGLPESDKEKVYQQFGFRKTGDWYTPSYRKLNDTAFELCYVQGFDGPYLIWKSFDRSWKMGFMTFAPKIIEIETLAPEPLEDQLIDLVANVEIVQARMHLIDSVSNGTRRTQFMVSEEDTAKNIYLVKVMEDNGSSLVTHFNFLVDASNMRILNPNGRLEGQDE